MLGKSRLPFSRAHGIRLMPWAAACLVACQTPTNLDDSPTAEGLFIMSGPVSVATPGDSLVLTAAIRDPLPKPVGQVDWSSSSREVATVDSAGVVRITGMGVAVVTAAYAAYSASTTVYATQAGAHSITVEPATAVVETGESLKFTATVRGPAGEELTDLPAVWVSSDTTVAVVEEGRVRALSPGETTVTAIAGGKVGVASLTVGSSDQEEGQTLQRFAAFPGVEGYGAETLTRCARFDVQVLKVTNTASSGAGSFQAALDAADDDRLTVVVFETGGTIRGGYQVERSCLYVAGQTAPGGGIQLHNVHGAAAFSVARSGVRDLVVRYLRFRSSKGEGGSQDAVSIRGGQRMVFDHTSAQFGNDEVFSIGAVAIRGTSIFDVTVSNTLIAGGLTPHSTGSLIFSPVQNPDITVSDLSFYGNLWAHSTHRNPTVARVGRLQLINTVAYNWAGNVGKLEDTTLDVVGNTFKAGPWTYVDGRADRIFQHDTVTALSLVYFEGNALDPHNATVAADQRELLKYVDGGPRLPDEAFSSVPLTDPDTPVTVRPAAEAYQSVVDQVGASRRLTCRGDWVGARDALDERIVNDVRQGTGPASVEELDQPEDLGGVPTLATGTPCSDGDGDGMPDAFEDRYGLDADDPADASRDPDGDGYVNIEEYVNGTRPN
ncbi:MAG: Ig-like domain-containing protein [Gemmatimonadetes bacterium]|nr:Ig-like domain-containing protein [Gemmatimonadota bacterium]